ncbi:MAG: cytidylate kinase [Alphaproteobacteria bacterium GWF2_58_20]|nr:MAG: cytidylate kinase [Alphaproteobacteria bacterium GWF2_58_20]
MNIEEPLVIAVDGPAASGKGTLARALAKALGIAYLDTGALYRAVALMVRRSGGDPAVEADGMAAAHALAEGGHEDIFSDPELRSEENGQGASKVSALPGVRAALLELQRQFARRMPGAVLDGRDIGTHVCPDARVKLFVTAKPEIRAKRRFKELQDRGDAVMFPAVLADIESRDARDSQRAAAPLKPADDAVLLDTSELGIDQVLDTALAIVRERLSSGGAAAS